MRDGINFRALMRDGGKIVPGSLREGHNIITSFGQQNISRLIAWSAISDTTDVAASDSRFRWIGVGKGTQPLVESVSQLNNPTEVSVGTYLAALDHASTVFPTTTSVKFYKEFLPAEISHAGTVIITEMGLFMDVAAPTPVLDPTLGFNNPSAYKVLDEGLVKMASFSLEVEWELKF